MDSTEDNETATTQVRDDDATVTSLHATERLPALVSLRGELLATPIPIERDMVTLGRALEADVRLNDSKASRAAWAFTAV